MAEESKRKQFIEAMKTRLDELDEDMERLEKRAQDARGEMEKKYEEQLADLQEKRTELNNKLTEMRAAGEAQFERLKLEAEHTWKAFQNSFKYFKSHFN